MTLLRFAPAALRASRFAVSPLAETLSEVIRLRAALDRRVVAPRVDAFGRWLRSDPFAGGLVRLVTATKYVPDLVAVPPGGGLDGRIDDELDAVRAIDDASARATLAEAHRLSWAGDGLGWAEVDGIAHRAADVVAQAWARFVEPDWSRRREVMARDIHHRAGLLAVRGWRHVLDGVAPGVAWVGHDAIRFSTQTYADRQVGGDGLVLVPHTGPYGQWTCESPSRIALVYPVRGAMAAHPPADGGVAGLVGAGRARVLAELRRPATPSQLATALGVSLGTVSAHLAALRRAGAVTTRRSGRAVYYELTSVGVELARLVAADRRVEER